jgi:hypothetical protein
MFVDELWLLQAAQFAARAMPMYLSNALQAHVSVGARLDAKEVIALISLHLSTPYIAHSHALNKYDTAARVCT